MAKRKKDDWPRDWRELIADGDDEILESLTKVDDPVEVGRRWYNLQKALRQYRNTLIALQKHNRPNLSHSEMRHVLAASIIALDPIEKIIGTTWINPEDIFQDLKTLASGHKPDFTYPRRTFFATDRLLHALCDLELGIAVDWLKVDRLPKADGTKPQGRHRGGPTDARLARGYCAGLMELIHINEEKTTYDEAGAFIVKHLPEDVFKWIRTDKRTKRCSPELIHRWLDAAREVGTFENTGFDAAISNFDREQEFDLRTEVGFELRMLGREAGIAPPDTDFEDEDDE